MLRGCRPSDASRICEIYNHFVRETVVTFEEEPVSEREMARRIQEVTEELPWMVWEEAGTIGGYAYATRWKSRSAYRFSTESTVYVAPGLTRRGIGTRLYEALVVELRRRNVHCVVGGIALPNAASIALHERLGFSKIGHFSQIGWKLGRWVDVGYWELLLQDG
ncbi:MAG TPA: arsinothricin resistance N-acetyltransferase ArsN1 family B [Steroidobacteraceae bacterium]|nr:arsinothricin resistance N-acetyltransferase ArsN1 family B [Steroidobacteraceae bacterium]